MNTLDLNPSAEFDVPVSVRLPGVTPAPARTEPRDGRVSLLGVDVFDVDKDRAIELILRRIQRFRGRPSSVYFVNAHTLNLAAVDPEYRAVLNLADYVFGDGTGVRWAARLQGVRLRDNVNGTDLVPMLLSSTASCARRYFLLGGAEAWISRAAAYASVQFPGWTLAGYHHGLLDDPALAASVILEIRKTRPDVLLVGMGNPLQEWWIHRHQHELNVPVCMGVGGLFDFWAGRVTRAPLWLRNLGHEWLWRLGQQPVDKARRYLVGNPLFLARILRDGWASRRFGPGPTAAPT